MTILLSSLKKESKQKNIKHMKKTTTTHNGRKTAVFVNQENFTAYLSKANTKSESTYLTVGGINPETGERNKIRLTGRQVASLRRVLSA
jgi:hypothetical protein